MEGKVTLEKASEYHFKAWIGSYGNYNAGILKGDWLTFPVAERKLEKFLEEVVGINEFNEEVMINTYDRNLFHLGESEDPYMINVAAMIWESLSDYDKLKVAAYFEYDGTLNLDELCNIMLQVDDIPFYGYYFDGLTSDNKENYTNEEKLGYMIAEENGLTKTLESFGSAAVGAFDYEAFGRENAWDLTLFDDGYLYHDAGIELNLYDRTELEEEANERWNKKKDREER